jgi:hypothetical protein
MSPNSTTYSPIDLGHNRNVSPISAPTPTRSNFHLVHLGFGRPGLKSKPAKYCGFPDQPDRAGMRERSRPRSDDFVEATAQPWS